jgi:hypothetical protein
VLEVCLLIHNQSHTKSKRTKKKKKKKGKKRKRKKKKERMMKWDKNGRREGRRGGVYSCTTASCCEAP